MENFIGKRVKVLRTDNGGEFTSKAFEAHLKACGIRHELTIPKTPEQNGVADQLYTGGNKESDAFGCKPASEVLG